MTLLGDLIARHYDNNNSNLARFLGVSPQAVGQWARRGFLPIQQARKVNAKHKRYAVKRLVDPELVGSLCGGRK